MSEIGQKSKNVIAGMDFVTRAMKEVVTNLGIFVLW